MANKDYAYIIRINRKESCLNYKIVQKPMPNSKTDDTADIKVFKSGSIEFDKFRPIHRIRCYQVDQKHAIVLLHYKKWFESARVIFMSLVEGIMFEYDCGLEHIMNLSTVIAKQYPNLMFAGCTLAGIVSLLNSLIQQHDAYYVPRDLLSAGVHFTDTHILRRRQAMDSYTARDIITGKQQNLHVPAEIFSFSPVHLLTIPPTDGRRACSSYFMP